MFSNGNSERRLAKREAAFHKTNGVAREYDVQSVAGLLCLARCGVEQDDESIDRISTLLAVVAQRHKIGPEEIAEALYMVEPDLRMDWRHEPPAEC